MSWRLEHESAERALQDWGLMPNSSRFYFYARNKKRENLKEKKIYIYAYIVYTDCRLNCQF